jgi:hypothetical protein
MNTTACEAQSTRRNAFHVWMSATKCWNHLTSYVDTEYRQFIATEHLYYIKSVGAGFTHDLVDSVGVNVVTMLNIDIDMKIGVSTCQNRLVRSKASMIYKRIENVTMNECWKTCVSFSSISLAFIVPSLSSWNWVKLKSDIKALTNALQAYSKYLQKHNEKQQQFPETTKGPSSWLYSTSMLNCDFTLHFTSITLGYVCVNDVASS